VINTRGGKARKVWNGEKGKGGGGVSKKNWGKCHGKGKRGGATERSQCVAKVIINNTRDGWNETQKYKKDPKQESVMLRWLSRKKKKTLKPDTRDSPGVKRRNPTGKGINKERIRISASPMTFGWKGQDKVEK